jgi:hypothetical protein
VRRKERLAAPQVVIMVGSLLNPEKLTSIDPRVWGTSWELVETLNAFVPDLVCVARKGNSLFGSSLALS